MAISTLGREDAAKDAHGLGDFWRSLLREDGVAFGEFIGRFHDYVVRGPANWAPEGCPDVEAAVPMFLRTPCVDAVAWIGIGGSEGFELLSHYPTVLDGCGEVDAQLISYEDWDPQWEGLVRVRALGKEFCFFDSLFPLARDRYVAGETMRLSLSGLACSVHSLGRIAENSSSKPAAVKKISQIYETGQAWFGHTRDPSHPQDLYLVMGKLLSVQRHALGDLALYRAAIELLPGVAVPVVFGATSIDEEGLVVEAGSWVAMMVFLHGFRTALAPRLQPADAP